MTSDRCPNCEAELTNGLCSLCLIRLGIDAPLPASGVVGETLDLPPAPGSVLDTVFDQTGVVPRVLLRDTGAGEEPLPITRPASGGSLTSRYRTDGEIAQGGIESLTFSDDTVDSFLDIPALAPSQRHEPETQRIDSSEIQDDEDGALDFLQPSTRPDSLGSLGHYEILEVLGKGGFGIVFRAFDETLQRMVAIKVLSAAIAATSPARKRFLREARSSAKVRHENIVQVYAVEEQPLPYLVMEFIPGETLQEQLDRTGPLGTTAVLELGRQIALGLAAAHGAGLIHRDIKPGNILLEAAPHPRVKITDFGLARAADDASLTQSGTVAGTPMFMAPEQAHGDALDHRADLFSFGSVLYTMCSGRPPFRASNTLAVLKRVTEDTPRPIPEIIPEVPQWLCDLITRLHAKNPADRFSSAQEVADLLAKGLEDLRSDGTRGVLPLAARPEPDTAEPTVPRTPDPGETVALPPRVGPRFAGRRHRVVAASLLLALLAGLGLAEASGVSNVRSVVVRLFFPDGTLVVEVDDPGVSVQIDGSDLVVTGTGVKEIRVKPGNYRVVASKDGRVVQQEIVRVERNGQRVFRVTRKTVSTAVADKGLGPLNRNPAAEVLTRREGTAAAHSEVIVKLQPFASGAETRTRSYMPQSLHLHTARPAGLAKAPELAAPWFGLMKLGPRESPARVIVAVDEPEDQPSRLHVDSNANGDLTDDPEPVWTPGTQETDDGREVRVCRGEAFIMLTLGGQRVPARFAFSRWDKNTPFRPETRDYLTFYADYGYEGNITLGDTRYDALLLDRLSSNDFRGRPGPGFSGVELRIDVNRNGRFDRQGETYDVRRPFNIKGTTYEITDMSASGDEFRIRPSNKSIALVRPRPALSPALSPGQKAIQFTARTTDGQEVKFPSTYAGKLVLLDFWATGCGPFIAGLPSLTRAYETFHDQGLEILGISLDEPDSLAKVASFTRDRDMPWRQVYDGKSFKAEVATLYAVNSIPESYLVDGDTGVILAAGAALRGERLGATIAAALAKKGLLKSGAGPD